MAGRACFSPARVLAGGVLIGLTCSGGQCAAGEAHWHGGKVGRGAGRATCFRQLVLAVEVRGRALSGGSQVFCCCRCNALWLVAFSHATATQVQALPQQVHGFRFSAAPCLKTSEAMSSRLQSLIDQPRLPRFAGCSSLGRARVAWRAPCPSRGLRGAPAPAAFARQLAELRLLPLG